MAIGIGSLLLASTTQAAEPQMRATVAASHTLTSPQNNETGWGPNGGVAGEVKVAPSLGVGARFEATWLPERNSPPSGYASNGGGNAYMVLAALRVYPLAPLKPSAEGLWISGSAGYVRTGSLNRFGCGADLGYDFWLQEFALGPYVGFRQITQSDSELRGDDARLGTVGVQAVWGPTRRKTPGDDDWDRDGIRNAVDACPRDPEDRDGFQDSDGCPDPDNDKDRLADASDKCPNDPEDYDAFEDADGCPELDNDKDRIADASDKCPNEPEDLDGFEDDDGCPDTDNDKDGIADASDKCPNEPETRNDYADEDGCPDEISVRVVGEHIYLDEKIYFEWNRAEIRSQSHPLLQRVASLLTLHPEYVQVSIEGHTDEMGTSEYNLRLSESRAVAVRAFLVRQGVAADRLVAQGLGESRPILRGKTEKAVTTNRRVEFLITSRRTILRTADKPAGSVEGAAKSVREMEIPSQTSAGSSRSRLPTSVLGGAR